MAEATRTVPDVRGGGHPSDGNDRPARAYREIGTAWAAAPGPVRAGAAAVVALAMLATLRVEVPLVSGIAVALLVPAALVDLHDRRLPDRIVGPAAAVLMIGTIASRLLGADLDPTGGLLGVAVFAGPLLLLHLISPAAMGFGDVKAGVVLGFALGLVHWQLALAALALATGLTASVGVLSRARTVAFGPGLVAAAAIALAMAPYFAPPATPDAETFPVDRPAGEPR